MLFGYSFRPALHTLRWITHLLVNPPAITKQSIVVAGIAVNVFSLEPDTPSESPASSPKPVAILFLLHGRTRTAGDMDIIAKAILDELQTRRKASAADHTHDLWIVTLDHRNHGSRLVDKLANQAWEGGPGKSNDRHALDMYAIQTGTAQDVSFLIDVLPWYLFPNQERTVSQWMVSGISLGGHSAWITLKNEPRVKLGIPIIGCPDYLGLISSRARESSVPVEPPYFPNSFLEYVRTNDPAAAPHTAADEANPFRGKRILVLSGQEDKLVPWSASKQFVDELDVGDGGVKEVVVEPDIGHTCSPTMIKEAVRFLWDNALAT